MTAFLVPFAIVVASAAAVNGPTVIVDVDVNDEVYGRPQPMTEADVDSLVGRLQDGGCEVLLIRTGYLGVLPYRTELSYPMQFDEDHARLHQSPVLGDVEGYIANRKEVIERYRAFLEACNPPEAFINAAHKRGMKAIVWIDMYDNFYPGYRSKFLEDNPHCVWTARDGKLRFPGLISYAFPEARAFCVSQAKELLALGADGIHCSTSAHCRHMPNSHKTDFYGYEQPVADAFKARYGVDIRAAGDFDKESWHDIKGEFVVQLYRELAEVCHAQGKELWIGLQLGRYTQFTVDPHFGTYDVVRYSNHWRTLVDEGIADAFILGDYEIAANPEASYWSLKTDIQRAEGQDLFQWAAAHYREYCAGKTKLYLFSEWLPGEADALEQRMSEWAGRVLQNGFDGIDVHEAWNFEGPAEKMSVLKRFSNTLKGRTE
ncbi:MAG TPA: hypothetical protein PLM14_05390 [Candidatus Hydrogenedentes bacterium]|nr:hypothetical protein [Candidatus Hydrogenedentota bacterium]HQE82412.1 hypothetical protein [Candidatus Hydrogenedentota bacterium]HQH51055.1 hypothetical protein [Candidatus Hydrogenedentota bacterium]HQM48777.1 hypothetical protein [Candidatus Hydrogenedentota bacterium]